MASVILLHSNSNVDVMACVDVKLFHSYIGAALPVSTRNHDYKYCHSSLCPLHGAAICDFRSGAELWFLVLGSLAETYDRPTILTLSC